MPGSHPEIRAPGKATGSDISKHLVTVFEPDGIASEAYRTLRMSLLYALMDEQSKVIVVTSPGPNEGKSVVCANLGVVLAQAGKSTLIVECDFRRPAMHKIFGLRTRGATVASILAGEHGLQEASQKPLADYDLEVLAVGAPPPDPAALLSSPYLSELLTSAKERFDYVLVSSPVVGALSDPFILARQGDGVLLALDAQKSRKGHVRRAVRSLEAVGARVIGTVMTNVKGAEGAYY